MDMNETERLHENEGGFRPRDMSAQPTFETILEDFISRRMVLGAAAAVPVVASLGSGSEAQAADAAPLTFTAVAENRFDQVTVPPGYEANVVIKWGDPVFPGVGAFDVNAQTPEDAAKRFGFNVDMIQLFPEVYGAPATIGRLPYPSYIMCTNHEYVEYQRMFPNLTEGQAVTPTQARIGLQSVGFGAIGIRLQNGRWVPNVNSRFNRRVTMTSTIAITGPAAGNDLMKTPGDPTGTRVLGSTGNCSGGLTPWGTYLSAEENFNGYWVNANTIGDARKRSDHLTDYGVTSGASSAQFGGQWELVDPRFDTSKPEGVNEPYRFGWIVEMDPYDPTSTPKKRTALGRCKHESCQVVISSGNRAVAYTGDDERFEYWYKFVSTGTVDPNNRAANMDLLDSGTLYAARFNADGTGEWLALSLTDATTGPLLRAATHVDGQPRFRNQGDVVINARRAGDIVGATPMDRPEDVEVMHNGDFRGDGRAYLVMTNNSNRGVSTSASRGRSAATNAANPRANNRTGHIILITEQNNDHAATRFTWRIFLLAGDPRAAAGSNTAVANTFTGDRFGSPDNVASDKGGNLWIATDGNSASFPFNDGLYACPTNLPAGTPIPVKRFLTVPPGAECVGPLLSPDNSSIFVGVQHPGEGASPDRLMNNGLSKWPGGQFPQPGVVAVRKAGGGRIGS